MKQWFLFDILNDGTETVSVIDDKANDNVYTVFRTTWEHLSTEEKERRLSFMAVFCEPDENGNPDMSTVTTTWFVI